MEKDTFKRVSALGHFALGTRKVKVIFLGWQSADGKECNKKAYWMDTETYDARLHKQLRRHTQRPRRRKYSGRIPAVLYLW